MFPCVFFLPFDFVEPAPIKYMDSNKNKNKNSNKKFSNKSFVMPRKYKGGLR